MLIIIEGCDGAGKTTLANRLHERLTATGRTTNRLHAGPIETNAIDAYEAPLYDYDPTDPSVAIICDRWHIGELVYGPLLRGETKLGTAERRHVDAFLASRGALVLHAIAPLDVLRDRLIDRGDDLVDESQVEEIVERYFTVLNKYHWVTTLYAFNGTNTGTDDIDEIIAHAESKRRLATAVQWNFATYVGPSQPQFLVLGERRNPKAFHHPRIAAFEPRANTSGKFLLDALPEDCARSIGIANACEENIIELWHCLGQPRIVALGREAQAQCRQADVPFGSAPHPQYIRRFHNRRQREYGQSIREALYFGRDTSHAFDHPSIRST